MNKLEYLQNRNDVKIWHIEDLQYRTYGRVLKGYKTEKLCKYMKEKTAIPESGNVYVPSEEGLEAIGEFQKLVSAVYGGMPVQAGYCNGRNSTVNGFEYHKGSEINIAVTDFLLFLGHVYEIGKDLTYHVDQAEVFYVPEGTVFEMYETTLHLSPCRVSDEGFRDIVILPRGTNTPLSEEEKKERDEAFAAGDKEARLLLQKNKWVISHPKREPLMKQGAFPGLKGPNKKLYY